MKQYQLAEKLITGYIRYLRAEERGTGTFEKYLLDAARAQGRERLSLLLEAICATGIREMCIRDRACSFYQERRRTLPNHLNCCE